MIPIPIIATIIVVLYILSAIKILREYERGVIFRLGRLLPNAKGPGIILVFAPVDRMVRISLRQEALERSQKWLWCSLKSTGLVWDS
jgi:regulator of protease activity HflC (stomatin/prohibitin superfamily)